METGVQKKGDRLDSMYVHGLLHLRDFRSTQ